jgi:hypothetical protein
MQRRVLLGAGAAVVVVAGVLVLRSVGHRQAGHALDQGVQQVLANLPPGYGLQHGTTEVNPLTGTLSVHDVVVTHDGQTIVTADVVTLSGADQQALRDVFDPAAYPNGHPAWTDRRLLLADASASGLHWGSKTPEPDDFRLGRFTLHRLSGRPFALPPTPQNRATPAFRADAALALSVDSLVLRDFTARSGGEPGDGMAVGSLSFSDYDAGKLGSAALKDLTLDAKGKQPKPTPVHLTLASAAVSGADAQAGLREIVRAGHVDNAYYSKLTYASLGLDDMAISLGHGPNVTIHGFHAEQSPADAAGTRTGHGGLHGMTIALAQMHMAPAAAAALAAFGMNQLVTDLDVVAHSNEAAHTVDVQEDWTLHDLGALRVTARLSGYTTAAATPGTPAMAALLGTTLDQATLTYEDHSLTGRLFAVAAAEMHTTPDLVRAQLAMPVVTLGLMLPDQPDVADQVTSFLNHPGTLTITINPPQKVTLGQVAQAPGPTRAHLLGVHITAK